MRFFSFLFCSVTILFFAGCGNNEPGAAQDNDKDRQPMLINWVDNIIVPSYEIFQGKLETMVASADAFSAAPSEASLHQLREDWVNAYIEWQNVELFEFGPADKYTLRNLFNIYPADVAGIEENIGNPSANLDVPSAYSQQGFPALDFLINGVAGSDAEIVAYYTDPNQGVARTEYLSRISTRMSDLLSNVVAEWPSYRETFVTKTGLDIGSSTGLVVNAYVLEYERYVRSGKVGIPAGVMIATGGVPQPEKVEAFYKKDISKTLALTAHEAARRFFNGEARETGAEGPSFKSYLDALEVTDETSDVLLSTIINDQFDVIESKLNALPDNFYFAVENENDKLVEAYNAMQALVRYLKIDMTSAMSVTITYTDNDGD